MARKVTLLVPLLVVLYAVLMASTMWSRLPATSVGHLARRLTEEAANSTTEAAAEALAAEEASGSGEEVHHEGTQGLIELLISWQVAILFLGFVTITIVWEFFIALFTYFTVRFSGRKALWVQRLKDEILALGVITLVLVGAEEVLAGICIKGDETEFGTAEKPEHECPKGQHLLFTSHRITETHLLLFTVAVVHIFYTCTSLYLSIYRMGFWRQWEVAVKGGLHTDVGPAIVFRRLCTNAFAHFGRMTFWNSYYSWIHQETYTLLRFLFLQRMDGAKMSERLPRQFNFLNIILQAMEVSFAEAAEHAWVLAFVVAVFLSIPIDTHALYWLAGLCTLTMLVASAKLQSILTHLAAIGYVDFNVSLQTWQQQFAEDPSEATMSHRSDTEMAAMPASAHPPSGAPGTSLPRSPVSSPLRIQAELAASAHNSPSTTPAPRGGAAAAPSPHPNGHLPAAAHASLPHALDSPGAGDTPLPHALGSPAAAHPAALHPGGLSVAAHPLAHDTLEDVSVRSTNASRAGHHLPPLNPRSAGGDSLRVSSDGMSAAAAAPPPPLKAALKPKALKAPPSPADASTAGAGKSQAKSPGKGGKAKAGGGLKKHNSGSPLLGPEDMAAARGGGSSGPVGESKEGGHSISEPLVGGAARQDVRPWQVAPEPVVGLPVMRKSAGGGTPPPPLSAMRRSATMRSPLPWWRRMLGVGHPRPTSRMQLATSRSQRFPGFEEPIEASNYMHRVKWTVRDPETGNVLKDMNALFWLESPDMLLWIIQLCYMENSLSLTLLLYGLIRDYQGIEKEAVLPAVWALIAIDVALMVFAAMSLLPMYAIVLVAGTPNPKRLMAEVKAAKAMSEDEEYENGIGGLLLRLFHITPAKRSEEEEEMDMAEGARNGGKGDHTFILALADQAGVILAQENNQSKPKPIEAVYLPFMKLWRDKANAWRNGAHDLVDFQLETCAGDVSRFARTYQWLARSDGSWAEAEGITDYELAEEMRELGTRCTAEEREDMLNACDSNKSGEINFPEMVLFMVFKFVDQDMDGFLGVSDLTAALSKLPPLDDAVVYGAAGPTVESEETLLSMIAFVRHQLKRSGGSKGLLNLPDFIDVFKPMSFGGWAALQPACAAAAEE